MKSRKWKLFISFEIFLNFGKWSLVLNYFWILKKHNKICVFTVFNVNNEYILVIFVDISFGSIKLFEFYAKTAVTEILCRFVRLCRGTTHQFLNAIDFCLFRWINYYDMTYISVRNIFLLWPNIFIPFSSCADSWSDIPITPIPIMSYIQSLRVINS